MGNHKLVKMAVNGSILLKSNKNKSKATSIKVQENCLTNMILGRITRMLKKLGFSFGIRLRRKCSEYRSTTI